jgi:HK97 family phage prohead protease
MPPLPQTIEIKTFPFLLKSVDEEKGIVTGYLSTFGNTDRQDDVVHKGAFQKTLQERKTVAQRRGKKALIPFLWMHNPDEPIGYYFVLEEDQKGLYCEAQLDISTNPQGIPNNPRAVMVFSGYKNQYIDEMSIGYEPIKKDYDEKSGVRNLREVRLWEGSAVTMLFAANPDAVATGVKAASGTTSWPIGERDEEWSGPTAHHQIVLWATNDDGTLNKQKMKSVHFWYDAANADKVTAYKLPFCYIRDGKPVAIPKGITTCAAVMQGSMGGTDIPDGDRPGVRAKIAHYYRRMRRQFDDLTIVPPWQNTDKNMPTSPEYKDFDAHYQQYLALDVLQDWSLLTRALFCAVVDAFSIGDQPDDDVKAALDQFGPAVLEWVEQAKKANLTQYLADNYGQQQNDYDSYPMYYASVDRSNRVMPDFNHYRARMNQERATSRKTGRAISKANKQAISDNIDALNDIADGHEADMAEHQKALKDMVAEHKAMISDHVKAMNKMMTEHKSMMQEHQDALNDLASKHKAAVKEHTKAIRNVAEDLSAVIGSPAYSGDDQDGQEEAAETGKLFEPRNALKTNQPDTPTDELDEFASILRDRLKR